MPELDNRDEAADIRDAGGEPDGGAIQTDSGGAGGETEVDWKAKAAEAEERLKQEREKALAEKQSLEDARRKLREYEASAQAAPPTGGMPDPVQQAVHILNQAESGEYVDPALFARANKVLMQAILQNQEMARLEDRVSSLPDEEQRAVRAYMQQGFPLAAARKAFRADQLELEREGYTKAEAERKAREEAERKRAEDDVVNTAPKPVPAADLRARTMTTDEYVAKLESLPRDEAAKLKARRDAGLLRLKD